MIDLSMTAQELAGFYIVMYIGAFGLILLGIFAVVVYQHLIRIILGLTLLEAGINLFLITISFRPDSVAPIASEAVAMVDPIPQALVLTSIVIGVSVQALALALVVKAYKAYGTLDMQVLSEKIAEETGTYKIDDIPVYAPVSASASPLMIENKSQE